MVNQGPVVSFTVQMMLQRGGEGASLIPGLDPIFPRVDAFLAHLPNLFCNTHTTFYHAFELWRSAVSTHIRAEAKLTGLSSSSIKALWEEILIFV